MSEHTPTREQVCCRRYETYAGWRRAVVRLGGGLGLHGNRDIAGARDWRNGLGEEYSAEWDGAHGEIVRWATPVSK